MITSRAKPFHQRQKRLKQSLKNERRVKHFPDTHSGAKTIIHQETLKTGSFQVTVYIQGVGYEPSVTYPLYVVHDTDWNNDLLLIHVSGAIETVVTDESRNTPVGTIA